MPSNSARQSQPFSSQKGGQRRKTISAFNKALLPFVNDLGPLLAYYLTRSNSGKGLLEDVVENLSSCIGNDSERKLGEVMANIHSLHESASTREKKSLLSIVAPVFNNRELRKYGFHITSATVASARSHANEIGPGALVSKGGRPVVHGEETQLLIQNFILDDENSYPAAGLDCRYFSDSISALFRKFKDKHREIKISETTFRNRLKNLNVRRPKKKTDYCQV